MMAAAGASSLPSRGHAVPFGRRAPPPPMSPRRGVGRCRRPSVSAHGRGSEGDAGRILDPRATPFQILGIDGSTSYSAAQLKAAFRAGHNGLFPIQMLSGNQEMMVERNDIDPFDDPECEPRDIFVNELLCIGTGCPYSCVRKAPHVFKFSDDFGTARVISQDNGEDDLVQLAVGQCPRKCIYYVTPCQRAILEVSVLFSLPLSTLLSPSQAAITAVRRRRLSMLTSRLLPAPCCASSSRHRRALIQAPPPHARLAAATFSAIAAAFFAVVAAHSSHAAAVTSWPHRR
ncbi:hypothetical protein PR202_ga04570 [Eleusine coracana subsp. coracana]|uniref:Uncharacterized protein n=1 Tax=Eleusine coracana subsp. coracana TaxID=191504 RepID=A0AAV5BPZ6_ELECO|nr:hypothetical protein PR202_ga04570 [Eleusine coracana subsp. coracana]